jgi:hypothetical protein
LGYPGFINNSPDIPPASPNSLNDEFNAALNTSTKWSWVNQGSATASDSGGWLALTAPAASGDSLKMLAQSSPSTPYTVTAKLCMMGNSQYNTAGLGFRESGTSKIEVIRLATANAGSVPGTLVTRFTDSTSFSANQVSISLFQGCQYQRINADGINITFYYSWDGVNFYQFYQEAKAAFFTTAPNQIILFSDSNNSSNSAVASVDWLRVQ